MTTIVLVRKNKDVVVASDGQVSMGNLAAAKVLMDTDLSAEDIAKKAIKVASDICVFTNNNVSIEKV